MNAEILLCIIAGATILNGLFFILLSGLIFRQLQDLWKLLLIYFSFDWSDDTESESNSESSN